MATVGPASGRRMRAYAYTLVTTAIVLIFALCEWAAEKYVAEHSRAAGLTLEIAIVLLAALIFRPIHQRVEKTVDEAFYRRKHKALAALSKFRRELSSFDSVEQLLRRVIEAVEQYLEAHACAIYLRRESFRAEASSFDVAVGDIDLTDPLVIRLRSTNAPAQPPALNSSAQGTHAFPMTTAGELIGILLVHCRHGDYDVEEAQMLSGLAQDVAAALAALDPRLRPRKTAANNIPADLPALIGRERELGEIRAALAQTRVLTLTGAGGVGKTCVALHCALQNTAEYADGAWFINLAPIIDGTLVATTMLAAINAGAAEPGGDVPLLVEHLRPRDVLLVLDNCEQVLAEVKSIAAQIRAACPGVTILATSRELLHLEGEHVYRLGPLRPEAGAELFAKRAAAVSPGFDPEQSAQSIRSLCEHLDGIPLAIELAAARTRTLTPNEILQHLDARFRLLTGGASEAQPKQRTLAATIEWSYGLLTAQEQSLFLRLSAFRGSFSLSAAAAVCAQGGVCDEFHVLDVLTSLADKSLLTVTLALTSRYRLLETIREFAAQKAVEQQATAIAQQQHAAYFAALAAQAYHEFDTHLPEGWLDRLAPDLDNLRAALVFLLEGAADRVTGAQLAADCGPIFLRMQLLTEGLRWCDAARRVPDLAAATAGRIEYVAAMLHNNSGAYPDALACAERAVSCYRRSADKRGLIRALSQLAQQYSNAKRYDEAANPAQQALSQARELGDKRVLATVLRRCAYSMAPAEMAQARTLFEEALTVARSASDVEEERLTLQFWAGREASGDHFERAIDLAGEALTNAAPALEMTLEGQIATWYLALNRVSDAMPHARRALQGALNLAYPLGIASALAICSADGAIPNARDAARVFGFARGALRDLNWTTQPDEARAFLNVAQALQARLPQDELDGLIQSGAALTQDEALRLIEPALTERGEAHDAPVAARNRVGTLLI